MHINDINRMLLKTQFPDYSKEIQVIIEDNEDFIELVNDYLFCKQELNRLSNSKKYITASEYKTTLDELKKEILAHLEVHKKIRSNEEKRNLTKL